MPENHTLYQERLTTFRKEIQNAGLDGFIIPRTDEFQGEFLAPYAERLAWLTGFTGSAGVAIVTQDQAVVMSDGRYTLQLEQQVPESLYTLGNNIKTPAGQWLSENIIQPCKIGYDLWLHTPAQIQAIEDALSEADANIELIAYDGSVIDNVWHDQPARPANPVSIFPNGVAGVSSLEKRKSIAQGLKEEGHAACLITVGDSICWLLNIRGSDIDYSPLCLSYALLHDDGSLDWFIEQNAVSDEVCTHIGQGVNIYGFDRLEEQLTSVSGRVALDFKTTPAWFVATLKKYAVVLENYSDPCVMPKACKTPQEQTACKQAHIEDGVAMVKFLHWLDTNANQIEMDELSIEEKLENFRRESSNYIGPSFPTIAGFASNGAIVHYRATPETSKKVTGSSLLLVDSGGQYRWGTTDITRTIAIGKPTQEMRENYTRVLKGHIAVSRARFDDETSGRDIDALARAPLQEVGLDYAHGTGHGVGCNLCVHESATSISPRCNESFKEGMLISNEPGYYKDHEYGIRIENLILTQRSDKGYYFETVTLAPYDRRLVCHEMLDEGERRWMHAYASQILESISPHLSDSLNAWLCDQIKIF